ncbi:proteophosphoglycan ppg4 [Rhodotorula toruloides]|uniref:Proteophosphoglycan ppg4 n=1 Tax=Rhodotorula toruloides TaxID=5286 RepID=A0A511KAF3_RHOTO|nr:proteophosphoglycan ppg4 [Rhodotorula toruloides]
MRHAHNAPGIITLPQAKLETPLKAEAVLAEALADAPEQAANASDNSDSAGAAATVTPSKSSRRRRGRANRQPSPPLPDAPGLDQPAPSFPSTTPPRSDFAALAGHSRSVPPDPLSVRQHQHSLADAWDMPAVPQQSADKPKGSLSWQQELLRRGSLGSHSRNGSTGKVGDSPAARARSRTAKATANPQPASNTIIKSRPPLTTSVSDFGESSNPALNWQQEILLRTDDAQLVQQQSSSANASSTLTPVRQRRNQIKDSITFGLAGLDLSEDDTDVFGSSASTPRRQQQQQQRPRAQQHAPVLPTTSTGYSTPVKVVPEARYAGPTFHNSPAPSSLPVPSFLLRRKAEGVAI